MNDLIAFYGEMSLQRDLAQMKKTEKHNRDALLALVKSGLWERGVNLSCFNTIDYKEVYRLAEEQSVVGLVAAGIEHVVDLKVPQEIALTFAGNALQLEQRNSSMNEFISTLYPKIVSLGLSPILLKGQGIAQCYERPLWRSSGDIDLLFRRDQYEIAKEKLSQFSSTDPHENKETLEYCLNVKTWPVEIHGSLHCLISRKMDKTLGVIQEETCDKKNYRIWSNGQVEVTLPSVNDDVIIIFTHILKHFFRGGIGLRQICDWCRLLWYYRDEIDRDLLLGRINTLGIKTEWEAFASFAVNILGMPKDSMPYYSESNKWRKKAEYILKVVIDNGNFGHNKDVSYQQKCPLLIRKIVSLWNLTSDSIRNCSIFPLDSMKSWGMMITNKLS